MDKKLLLIASFQIALIYNALLFAQMDSEKQYPFLYTYGFIKYKDNIFSEQVIKNRYGAVLAATGYFKNNCYLRVSIAESRARLFDSVIIEKNTFLTDKYFHLTSYSFCLGYKKDFWKRFQISGYSGVLFNEYHLDNVNDPGYRSKIGIPLGLDLNWRYKITKKPNLHFALYFNNSINYSRLYKASDKFSNSYYAYEFGFGIFNVFSPKRKTSKNK